MRIFNLLFFLLISSFLFGQKFYFVADSMSTKVKADSFENQIANFVVNNTDKEINLRWTQHTIFKGSQWSDPQICDNDLCYLPIIKTRTLTLAPRDTSLMKLLFQPNFQDTSGYFIVTAQEDRFDEIDATGHYFFEESSLQAHRITEVETVKIYPNPSSDVIQFTSPKLIVNARIYNSAGQTVVTFDKPGNEHLSIQHLNAGVYYAIFKFDDGQLGVTKISKL